jgi:hypothetical protein
LIIHDLQTIIVATKYLNASEGTMYTNKIKRKQENKIVASYVVENLPNFDPHISKKQRIQTKHKQR